MRAAALVPNGHHWLRVCRPDWDDPLDAGWAEVRGGRWNPPGSWPTLYLNRDIETARGQITRLLASSPVEPDDLTDDAFQLIAATLPDAQVVVDIVTEEGIVAVGLPRSYPRNHDGTLIAQEDCWPIARSAHAEGLDGVECRSAAIDDGRELAWWPGTRSATPVGDRVPYGAWRR